VAEWHAGGHQHHAGLELIAVTASRAGHHMAKHKKDNQNKNGKMKRKLYEKELLKLQVELCHLQEWVKAKGLKIIIVFEGPPARAAQSKR
jgi:polyphosphate kinase 2 (PPK2 family)